MLPEYSRLRRDCCDPVVMSVARPNVGGEVVVAVGGVGTSGEVDSESHLRLSAARAAGVCNSSAAGGGAQTSVGVGADRFG
jgi:hypothetical protein